jgi:soluble lytic murein transglycosylase-like protein
MKYILTLLLVLPSLLIPAERIDITKDIAKKHKVRAYLLRGIAYAETGAWSGRSIRKTIRSKSGAIGIMQLMPLTGRHYCKGLDLENPRDNIECGAIYIKWLQRHYCGYNDYCVAASYLNGPNAVRRGRISRITYKYWRKVKRGTSRRILF